MAYEVSEAAANDIEEILEYSYQSFGVDVAVEYHLSLLGYS